MTNTIVVPPGWLLYENQLINTEFLYLIESVGRSVILRYMTGKTITIPISMSSISFMLNEAQVSALLDKPEQAMLLSLKADNAILKQKLAKLEAGV